MYFKFEVGDAVLAPMQEGYVTMTVFRRYSIYGRAHYEVWDFKEKKSWFFLETDLKHDDQLNRF